MNRTNHSISINGGGSIKNETIKRFIEFLLQMRNKKKGMIQSFYSLFSLKLTKKMTTKEMTEGFNLGIK
jgi:hypothetical protein